jgi:hypothetical protein
MKFDGESVERVGFLRLRGRLALRSRHSAQNDNFQVFVQPDRPDRTP